MSGLPGMCSIHANSARGAIVKLCTLPLLAGENVGHAFAQPPLHPQVRTRRGLRPTARCRPGSIGPGGQAGRQNQLTCQRTTRCRRGLHPPPLGRPVHLARRAFRCRIRARGLLGAGALLLAVSGCSGEGDTDAGTARVAGLPEDVGGIVVRDAGREPTWVYGAMPVCLQAPGEVRLVELRPALVNGAKIVSSGVRLPEPGVEGIATLPGPLPSTYQQLGDLTLKAVCVDGEPGPERAVEVRPAPQPTTGSSSCTPTTESARQPSTTSTLSCARAPTPAVTTRS